MFSFITWIYGIVIHFNLAKCCIENFTLHDIGNCFEIGEF